MTTCLLIGLVLPSGAGHGPVLAEPPKLVRSFGGRARLGKGRCERRVRVCWPNAARKCHCGSYLWRAPSMRRVKRPQTDVKFVTSHPPQYYIRFALSSVKCRDVRRQARRGKTGIHVGLRGKNAGRQEPLDIFGRLGGGLWRPQPGRGGELAARPQEGLLASVAGRNPWATFGGLADQSAEGIVEGLPGRTAVTLQTSEVRYQ